MRTHGACSGICTSTQGQYALGVQAHDEANKLESEKKAASPKLASEQPKSIVEQSSQPQITLSVGANVYSVAFSPDGTRIATGSYGATAKVWDAQSGKELLTLKGHSSSVNSVSFSPDGKRIVTGSYDDTAKVWDAQSGKELLTLKGHSQSVNSVALSPDGTRIVTGSCDATAKVWDAQSGKEHAHVRRPSGGILAGRCTQLPFRRMARALLLPALTTQPRYGTRRAEKSCSRSKGIPTVLTQLPFRRMARVL